MFGEADGTGTIGIDDVVLCGAGDEDVDVVADDGCHQEYGTLSTYSFHVQLSAGCLYASTGDGLRRCRCHRCRCQMMMRDANHEAVADV